MIEVVLGIFAYLFIGTFLIKFIIFIMDDESIDYFDLNDKEEIVLSIILWPFIFVFGFAFLMTMIIVKIITAIYDKVLNPIVSILFKV